MTELQKCWGCNHVFNESGKYAQAPKTHRSTRYLHAMERTLCMSCDELLQSYLNHETKESLDGRYS